MEVPVNSPNPFANIKKITTTFDKKIICGSGTVLTKKDVERTANSGGKFVIMPNTNPNIIKHCIEYNLIPIPGFATVTEAMVAIQAGAQYLKLFPSDTYGVNHVLSLQVVLPSNIKIIAVGRIKPKNITDWLNAGIFGFGIESDLFKPEFSTTKVYKKAQAIINTLDKSC